MFASALTYSTALLDLVHRKRTTQCRRHLCTFPHRPRRSSAIDWTPVPAVTDHHSYASDPAFHIPRLSSSRRLPQIRPSSLTINQAIMDEDVGSMDPPLSPTTSSRLSSLSLFDPMPTSQPVSFARGSSVPSRPSHHVPDRRSPSPSTDDSSDSSLTVKCFARESEPAPGLFRAPPIPFCVTLTDICATSDV